VAFGLALELAPDDFPNRRRLAALHQEDQEWDAAILQLTECAKRIREPAEGIEVFYALGGLYLDHTDPKDLAEKSFVKVLGWDRTHFAAMEKLANVYAATGNWQRAAQALERLVALTDKTSIKVANLIALSSVLESRLQRVDAAEKVLSEARQLAPQDIAPIEALAGMYTRQQDPMALNVLLDQALASLSAAVSEQPDADELYLNILGILNMKAEDGAASLAAAALRLLGATPAPRGDLPIDAAEIRWDAGARIGAPALIDFLCPKEIPAGLRETLRVVEGPIARLAGVSAKQLGLGRDKRLDRKHPLVQHSSQLAGAFGIRPEPQYFVEAGSGLRIGAGSPAAVVVPPAVAESKDEAVIRFIVAQALMTVRHGLSLALMLPPAQLVQTAAALTKLSIPSLTVPDLDPGELDATAARIREAVPEKLLGQITPFAFDCQNALAVPDLAIAINSVGQRAGFMGAGSLTGAFQGLRVAAGQPTGPLATLPGAGRLMSFVFSKDHLELRRQMGL